MSPGGTLPGCRSCLDVGAERFGDRGLRELPARRSIETPIIIVSARSEELDIVVSIEVGADDYVAKLRTASP